MAGKPTYEQLEQRVKEVEKELKTAKQITNAVDHWHLNLAALQNKMVANIGDVIVIIDENGVNRYKSANIRKLFGWKPEQVVGKSAWENVHPYDLETTRQFFETLRAQPDTVGTTQCRYRCRDGSYKWIEFTGINLFDDPDIKGILGNYHDISERIQAEKSLRESEARFKALHNASFGGIAIHDKGIILDCNKGLSDITGYPVSELIGMDGLLLICEEDREMVMNNIVTGYEAPYEAVGLRKNGDKFPMRLEARGIPYKGKKVRTVEFRDITDRKLAEKERESLQTQLIQAQKMESIGRLAGGVAHDFNNMLSIIIGNAEIIMQEADASYPFIKNLEEIYNAADRSSELTRQLLAFASRQTADPRVLDLNHVLNDMYKMLKRLIGEDIDLTWLPAPKLGYVKIDPSQVDQIIANLCVNSRDAIEKGGRITIETDNAFFDEAYCKRYSDFSPGHYVMVAVSDNGSGMDKELLNNIFEPFFTTKAVGLGSGLGLATVYGIVKQNKGFINIYSEPGQGTTFKIYLPIHSDNEPLKPEKKSDVLPEKGNETILVVEDEKAILAMTRATLERLGYTVLATDSPREAVSIVKKAKINSIHLLLTDVVMPQMNGRELSQKLIRLHPGLKCLFMSGYTADVIAHHGVLDSGIQFINKPFSRKDLAAKIRQILGKADSF